MELTDTIFGAIIYDKLPEPTILEHLKLCRDYFFAHVPKNIFKNEYCVFYDILQKRKDIITLSETSLSIILERNRGVISQNTTQIDFEEYKAMLAEGDTNDEVDMFLSACMVKHEELCELIIPFDEFKDALSTYIENFKMEALMKAIPTMQSIMITPYKRKNKVYSGYEGAKTYIYEELTKIDNIAVSNESARKGYYTVDTKYYTDATDQANSQPRKIIGDFILDPINKAIGGIYSNAMVAIHAPTKGCKSRYSADLVHNAVVNYGTDVALLIIEGSANDWMSFLRARHFQYFYNRESNVYTMINNDHIKNQTYHSEEYKRLEYSSFYDLCHNPNYGKIHIIDKSVHVHNIIEEIEQAYKAKPFQLLCIDYLGVMDSKEMSKTESLSRTFPKILKLQKDLNFATILPNQFTQETVRAMFAEKKVDVRTIAGVSYETIKTPDVNIGLYGTVEEMQLGMLQFFYIPSREGSYFETFYTQNNIGVCEFSYAGD